MKIVEKSNILGLTEKIPEVLEYRLSMLRKKVLIMKYYLVSINREKIFNPICQLSISFKNNFPYCQRDLTFNL